MDTPLSKMTFFQSLRPLIESGLKTVTIRDESESHYVPGSIVSVHTLETDEHYCHIRIRSVEVIRFDDIDERVARQEGLPLSELKSLIRRIYPNEERFYLIAFELCQNVLNRDVIVTRSHESLYPDPIGFQKGESLTLGKLDTEYPGWIWTMTSDGNAGWAPLQYIQVNQDDSSKGQGRRPYTATELNTVAGQSLTVQLELNGWYLVVNASGSVGWVPKETVTPVAHAAQA